MLIDDNLYLVRRVVLQTGYRRGLQQTISVLFYDFVISRLLIYDLQFDQRAYK